MEKQEDPDQHILTRRIITFRQVGNNYRRDDEVYCQRLYAATEISTMLQQVGYQVEIHRCYGQFPLPNAHATFVARKSTSKPSLFRVVPEASNE